jgi:hypothetical protein
MPPRPVDRLDPRVHQHRPAAGIGDRAGQQQETGKGGRAEIDPDPPRHPLAEADDEEGGENAGQGHQREEVAERAVGVAGEDAGRRRGVERPGGHRRPEATVGHGREPAEGRPDQEGRAHLRRIQRLVPFGPPHRLVPVGALGLPRVVDRLARGVGEHPLEVGDQGRHCQRRGGDRREGRDLQAAHPRTPSSLDPQQRHRDRGAHQNGRILRRKSEAGHRARQESTAVGPAAAHGAFGAVERGEDEEGRPWVDGDHRPADHQRRQDGGAERRQEPRHLTGQPPRQEPGQGHNAEAHEQSEGAAEHDQLRRLDDVVENRRERRKVLHQRVSVRAAVDRRADPGRSGEGGERQGGVQIPAGVPAPGPQHADRVMEDVPLVDVAEIGVARRDRGEAEAQREEEDRRPEPGPDLGGGRHEAEDMAAAAAKKDPARCGVRRREVWRGDCRWMSVSREIYAAPRPSVWAPPPHRIKKTQEI